MAKDSKGESPFIHRLPVKDRSGKIVGYKEVVAYRGLLHLAHEAGLRSVRTEILQFPTVDNGQSAIVQASVRTWRGTFTGIGDANPKNVSAKVAPHIIRMAETRAEARALRKALDIGTVALEELEADLEEGLTYEGAILPEGVHRASGTHTAPPSNGTPRSNGASSPPREERTRPSGSFGDDRATDAQRKFLFRLVHEAGYSGDEARAFIHKELGRQRHPNGGNGTAGGRRSQPEPNRAAESARR